MYHDIYSGEAFYPLCKYQRVEGRLLKLLRSDLAHWRVCSANVLARSEYELLIKDPILNLIVIVIFPLREIGRFMDVNRYESHQVRKVSTRIAEYIYYSEASIYVSRRDGTPHDKSIMIFLQHSIRSHLEIDIRSSLRLDEAAVSTQQLLSRW